MDKYFFYNQEAGCFRNQVRTVNSHIYSFTSFFLFHNPLSSDSWAGKKGGVWTAHIHLIQVRLGLQGVFKTRYEKWSKQWGKVENTGGRPPGSGRSWRNSDTGQKWEKRHGCNSHRPERLPTKHEKKERTRYLVWSIMSGTGHSNFLNWVSEKEPIIRVYCGEWLLPRHSPLGHHFQWLFPVLLTGASLSLLHLETSWRDSWGH